jgi:UDP-N-acetylmuramate--alanine ligase
MEWVKSSFKRVFGMKKVFFVGINGIGMSALAKIMINEGYEVYGSDIARKEITEQLEAMGAKIYSGHLDLNAKGMDMVVYTSAENLQIQSLYLQNLTI